MYVFELRTHRRDVYATLVLLSPSLSSASKVCQSNQLFVSCCFVEGGRCVYIYIYLNLVFQLSTYGAFTFFRGLWFCRVRSYQKMKSVNCGSF